jgi:hypothetical protein
VIVGPGAQVLEQEPVVHSPHIGTEVPSGSVVLIRCAVKLTVVTVGAAAASPAVTRRDTESAVRRTAL